tara:strand:- start:1889 stop:2854 length:966 start_codon:yes stop_codon:yes gene_type:complete
MIRLKAEICILILLISVCSVQSVSAQPDLELGSWDIGFTEGENITKEINEDGDISVQFWVSNDFPFSIEVSFDFDAAFGANFDNGDVETISAGANESFSVEFYDVDVLAYRAEKREAFTIKANVESYQGVPALLGDEKSISGELTIPHIRGFEIDILDLGGAMNAGTELELKLEIRNVGNDVDLVDGAKFNSKSCPQLEVPNIDTLNEVSLDAPLEGQTGVKSISVTLIAPESHPTKNCDLEIEIGSKGSINDGKGSIETSDEITFEVKKLNPEDEKAEGDASNSGSNGDNEKVSRNFMPGFSLILTIQGILCALFVMRKE